MYIKKKYNLKISKKKYKITSKYWKRLPLFLNTKIKLIKSFGEYFVEFINKPRIQMLLIYPEYNLSTKKFLVNLEKVQTFHIKKV